MISLNEIILGEDARLKNLNNPFIETGFLGSAIALFSLHRIKNNDIILSNLAESHLYFMRNTLKDKISLEFNNGLSGVGLGLTWLVENGYISGDLNIILKEIDDRIYKYCVNSLSVFNPKYESTYIDILIYLAIRIKYLKSERINYNIFVRLAQMLYDHIYFNVSLGFFMEPRPANLRYKLFLFVFVSGLLCKNGDSYIRSRISNVFNEVFDVIVSIHPFCAVNRFMLYQAIDFLIPYLEDNKEKWKDYSFRLANDVTVEQMIDEALDNDMSVFHGIPYIYIILKSCNTVIPHKLLCQIKNKIEYALSFYSNYNDCEKWNYVGLSGIMGAIVVLEDIKTQLTHE